MSSRSARTAGSWPAGAADYLPVTHGQLRSDDAYFRGRVAPDFLWSVAFEAR
jgi:hypothetical protein